VSANISSTTLHTERLVLRPAEPDDAPLVWRYVVDNREHLGPWEPARGDAYFTQRYWESTLAIHAQRERQGHRAAWLIFDRRLPGSVAGRCALDPISRGPFQSATLGCSLAANVVGKGLMHEALTALIGAAFGALDLRRIEANVRPENERSLRMLDRLGFVREGFSEQFLEIGGEWCDHVRTALVRDSATLQPSSDARTGR